MAWMIPSVALNPGTLNHLLIDTITGPRTTMITIAQRIGNLPLSAAVYFTA